MSKSRASDDVVMAFMAAVYPTGAALAVASFDEYHVLTEATRLIVELRASIMSVLQKDARKTQEINVLVAENRSLITLQGAEEHAICRLQLPDGSVPTDNVSALVGWKRAYDRLFASWAEQRADVEVLRDWRAYFDEQILTAQKARKMYQDGATERTGIQRESYLAYADAQATRETFLRETYNRLLDLVGA